MKHTTESGPLTVSTSVKKSIQDFTTEPKHSSTSLPPPTSSPTKEDITSINIQQSSPHSTDGTSGHSDEHDDLVSPSLHKNSWRRSGISHCVSLL